MLYVLFLDDVGMYGDDMELYDGVTVEGGEGERDLHLGSEVFFCDIVRSSNRKFLIKKNELF